MKICKVDNCSNKQQVKGYCKKHYLQVWRYGKILKRTRNDKNEIINYDNYYEICLYYHDKIGEEQRERARAKIDKDDLLKIQLYKWGLLSNGYVIARINKKIILLHRLIMGDKKGQQIDHINHNKLDNRKQNLRWVTNQQNNWNKKSKGVYYDNTLKSRKWLAAISINGKRMNLGRYKRYEEAERVRRKAEQKYFGKFAYKY